MGVQRELLIYYVQPFKKKGIKVNLIAGKGSKKYGGQLYTYSTLIPYSKNYFSRIYNRLHVIAGLI